MTDRATYNRLAKSCADLGLVAGRLSDVRADLLSLAADLYVAPPKLWLGAPELVTVEGDEGVKALRWTVTRSGDASEAISATWNLSGTIDHDDLAPDQVWTGPVELRPLQDKAEIVVWLAGDRAFEPDETATVTLSAPIDCELGETVETSITVANDDAPPNRSGLPWRSGFRLPRNTYDLVRSEYPKVEQWRGRPLDVVDQFLGMDIAKRNWAALVTNYVLGGTKSEPAGTLQATFDGGWIPSLAIPLLILSEQRRFDRCAAGLFDAAHRAVARRIAEIAAGRTIYVRLGWECNEGYPWSILENSVKDDGTRLPDDADWRIGSIPDNDKWRGLYAQAWARIARIYKEEIPGAVMVWNHLRDTRRAMALYYPGDDVVDLLGMDPYDMGYGGWVVDEKSWTKFAGSYNAETGKFFGPAGLVGFAKERGKKVCFCEWGCWNKPNPPETTEMSPLNPANNRFYVTRMVQFFQELAAQGLIEYECYFHAGGNNPHQIFPDTEVNPLVREAYLDAYRPLPEAA